MSCKIGMTYLHEKNSGLAEAMGESTHPLVSYASFRDIADSDDVTRLHFYCLKLSILCQAQVHGACEDLRVPASCASEMGCEEKQPAEAGLSLQGMQRFLPALAFPYVHVSCLQELSL